MRFPLGKPILILGMLAFVGGLTAALRQSAPRAELLLWTFDESHARMYRDARPATQPDAPALPSLIAQFQSTTGISAQVDLLSSRAEDIRLISLFMSQSHGDDLPDLCEVEINSVGKFLRPPINDIGFMPLNDFLKSSGQYDRILKSRFAPWSKIDPRTGQSIIFGLPNDVHPVTITYRKDLFDEAGLDPEGAKTWPEFQSLCEKLQTYRAAHGHPDSRAIELNRSATDHLAILLLQRHINIIDSSNKVHFTDPKVANTVAFYAQMVAGDHAIGADAAPAQGLWTRDLADGDVCAVLTPDWRAGDLEHSAPQLAGKVRMMPLPRFDPDDSPTSTWGGTMIGIPKATPHPQEAWKLMEYLYLSADGTRARFAGGSQILPPIPELWADPMFHQPDPYDGGQKVLELYTELAPPFSVEAQIALLLVLEKAEDYVQSSGPAGLETACQGWLKDAQAELQSRIDFGKFDP
jgi:arabinosaccharide transport system substrate-binding protein